MTTLCLQEQCYPTLQFQKITISFKAPMASGDVSMYNILAFFLWSLSNTPFMGAFTATP